MTATIISTEILIRPYELHSLTDHISEKLRIWEKQIFSNQYGYIEKILKIESITFISVCYATHDGSMIFEIKFRALCTNPQPNNIIDCIVFLNENIMVGVSGCMHIVIQTDNDDYSKSIKKGNKVQVKVIKTSFDMTKNIIRVLGHLVNE